MFPTFSHSCPFCVLVFVASPRARLSLSRPQNPLYTYLLPIVSFSFPQMNLAWVETGDARVKIETIVEELARAQVDPAKGPPMHPPLRLPPRAPFRRFR